MLVSIHSALIVSIPGHHNKLQEQTLRLPAAAVKYCCTYSLTSFQITNQDEHSAGITLKLPRADEGTYPLGYPNQCCFKFGLVV